MFDIIVDIDMHLCSLLEMQNGISVLSSQNVHSCYDYDIKFVMCYLDVMCYLCLGCGSKFIKSYLNVMSS